MIIVIVAEREEKIEDERREKRAERENEKENEKKGREKERERKREREKEREKGRGRERGREKEREREGLPVCKFKTSPCVQAKRLRVYWQNARMLNTCARFAGSHGGVLLVHTETFRTYTRGVFRVPSRATQRHHTHHTAHHTHTQHIHHTHECLDMSTAVNRP